MTITAVPAPDSEQATASPAEAEKYRADQERLDGFWTADTEWQRSFEGEACAQDLLHEEPVA